MPDPLTPIQRHTCMSHIRSKDTKPELRLRKELFRIGYRYRINVKGLAGTPDIVLPMYHTCIFVNGCFWHGHKGCSKYVQPKSNSEFWINKFGNNQERDLRNYRDLESRGWSVIVVWECELEKARIEETVNHVQKQLQLNKQSWETEAADRRRRRKEWSEEIRRRKQRNLEILNTL